LQDIDLEYYFAFVGAKLIIDPVSFCPRAMVGVTEDGVEAGYGGSLRLGDKLSTNISGEYQYYPSHGPYGSLEFTVGTNNLLLPFVKLSTFDIPQDSDSSILLSGGFVIKISDKSYIKPSIGAGGRSTSDTGINAGLDMEISF
jgi:hypothetical protein